MTEENLEGLRVGRKLNINEVTIVRVGHTVGAVGAPSRDGKKRNDGSSQDGINRWTNCNRCGYREP